ncbi:MAG: hypothetical protein OHK93_008025 [Ramalina farinacea]|uniref:Enoyl-CoA hydratase n=1 Tax=Ramalina farinacea TaxID=258253 RepID=A0AA43QNT1_9LECA|nr:hypothetical protein [Ramalina farinacea]
MAPIPPYSPQLQTQPPSTSFTTITFPAPHTLLVTLNRPKQLNCINSAGHRELDEIWTWFDNEPELRVGIVTGAGRAFCAGADLKVLCTDLPDFEHPNTEWNSSNASARARPSMPPSGFGGLSRRRGKKPVIAAVNGIAHGGGCEIIVNTDIVLASPAAKFALPEVKRGVAAIAGALPRLIRTLGRQRAMEMALTGREVGAEEARAWGLVNQVAGKDGEGVVELAVKWAGVIAGNSPDSVIVSKAGVELGWEGMGVEEASGQVVREGGCGRGWKGGRI